MTGLILDLPMGLSGSEIRAINHYANKKTNKTKERIWTNLRSVGGWLQTGI